MLGSQPLLVDRMTGACENITLPQTSFAGGKMEGNGFALYIMLLKQYHCMSRKMNHKNLSKNSWSQLKGMEKTFNWSQPEYPRIKFVYNGQYNRKTDVALLSVLCSMDYSTYIAYPPGIIAFSTI